MLTEVNKILEAFALNVISQAKNNLSKKGISNGDLYNSLTYNISDADKDIELDFEATDYARFYDLGVQGAAPSKMPPNSLKRYNKAPMSPYKFGSGSGRKGGLTQSISNWVYRKGIKGRDQKTGRFITQKSAKYLITRSIYLTGLQPSNFFTAPFDKYFKQLETELEDALGKDIEIALSEVNEPLEITVTIPK